MRDTGDMMEDVYSEDTMMECSGDDAGLDDLVDLTDDVSNSVPMIRDAAERLLTLLGVDNEENDDLLSSEDEGVELDEESDENDVDYDNEDNEPQNTRLLHQLANSLAQELKYSQKQGNKTNTRLATNQRGTRSNHELNKGHGNEQVQSMEVGHEIFYENDPKTPKYVYQFDQAHKIAENRSFFSTPHFETNDSVPTNKYHGDNRSRISSTVAQLGKTNFSTNSPVPDSWSLGWDACAAEAIRYLVEDEGLSPHHPTVLAMKNHLEIQRERTLAQFAV
ncbi:uncharacterized protein [Venturia canescens]|uniref:uncharacterized protein n=1 Tax=Venturia canescens TaxID=32260 RepID=UPI001C9C38E5|nr:uncharacterized protein LOC122413392 [Venturia canescens]XP_043279639.1 uncharacterized protein LOC122413392 [Venturia canescens]XP_043279641.1 uncharacterized protein LOC122413392 [Venturia canescens]XP_043279642.1 uncharacterized protein LOC122413392 [Venturia canescens]XP_043279643.1 uncharacterized protein LOC122413392 [Venturia canescens]